MSYHNEKYRPDIDGLRAIAVLSVVAFHSFPSVLAGGFVGVDVFFVISGFLISEIIIGSLEQDRFSFADFYKRRIKRIFPALLLVLTAVYAVGWFSLLSVEYAQLGKHITGGALFVSNLVLWRESGYFDNAAITKPLLHLWSLGVEEQFYIFWPLILWLGAKRKLNILVVIVIIALASFVTNVVLIERHAAAAFYSPVTRFWELMFGAMLAYFTFQQHRLGLSHNRLIAESGAIGRADSGLKPSALHNAIGSLGIVLLAIAIGVISENKHFPGWWALMPTVGTVLVIAAGQQSWMNRVVLSNPILMWFGLISYPLYLWHWPLYSFARILLQGPPSVEIRVSIALISIVLAWLTYEAVEKPIRFGKNSVSKIVGLAVPMIIIACIGIVTYRRDGLTFRSVVKDNARLELSHDGGWPHYLRDCDFVKPEDRKLFTCKIDSRSEPSYALIGDSKAGALLPGLARSAPADRTWLYFGSGGSGPLFAVLSQNPAYVFYQTKPVETAIGIIESTKSVQTVVIAVAARALFGISVDDSLKTLPASKLYGVALDGLDNTVTTLLRHGKEVVLLMDNPTLPHMEDCINRKTSVEFINVMIQRSPNPDCRLPILEYRTLSKQYRDMLYEIESKHPNKVRIFDATGILCDEQSGLCLPDKNGRLLYGISDHISDYASTLVGTELNRFLASSDGK
jgi:peptidoglycan/LPS O-acetylase OafA/YrhL